MNDSRVLAREIGLESRQQILCLWALGMRTQPRTPQDARSGQRVGNLENLGNLEFAAAVDLW